MEQSTDAGVFPINLVIRIVTHISLDCWGGAGTSAAQVRLGQGQESFARSIPEQ